MMLKKFDSPSSDEHSDTSHEDEIEGYFEPPPAPPFADPRKKGFLFRLRDLFDSLRTTLVVLGSAIILFIAASNTITWHLQRVWGASGDYWQRQWERYHGYFHANHFMMVVVGGTVVINIVFWGFNMFFMILDTQGRPQALMKYKIQKEKNVPLSGIKLWSVVRYVTMNQLLVGIPTFILAFYAYKWRGCDFGPTLPTFHWMLFELAMYSLVEELFFYYSHRLFHHPYLYKHIHKIHHEYQAPIGVRSIYAHPVEHLMANLLPPLMGPFLMGSHIANALFWFCLALMSTTVAHCGYHFPFLPSPEAHDYHHLKFNNNFGVMGILDRLHGTDNYFRQSVQFQRHFFLTSFTPVSELIPDPKEAKQQGCTPLSRQGSPGNKQGSPGNKQGSPGNKQGSPSNKQESPSNKQGLPGSRRGSPAKAQ